jgi:hypothetical protein
MGSSLLGESTQLVGPVGLGCFGLPFSQVSVNLGCVGQAHSDCSQSSQCQLNCGVKRWVVFIFLIRSSSLWIWFLESSFLLFVCNIPFYAFYQKKNLVQANYNIL